MMKLLKRLLRGIAGVGGMIAATAALTVAAKSMELDQAWSVHRYWICLGCTVIPLAVWWLASPTVEAELLSAPYSRWINLFGGSVVLVDFTLPHTQSDVRWMIEWLSFGVVELPELSKATVTLLRLTALAGITGAFVYAFRQFRGFNRFVLCLVAFYFTLLVGSLFVPKLFEYIGLIVGGFVVALSWGGPIGEGARNVLSNVMRAFRIRRTSGPTSFEIPTKGVNVKDL